MAITHIPYDPQSDWRAYFAKGIENMLSGLTQQMQQKREVGDVRDVGQFMQGGGNIPSPTTGPGMQLLSRILQGQIQTPLKQAQTDYYKARTEAVGKKKAKTYDIDEINDQLYEYTHDKKTGELLDIDRNDLFTLKRMVKGTGYRLRKITFQEAKKKKMFGIDWLWPDQQEEKTRWVLEDATGQIIPPTSEETNTQTKTPPAGYPDAEWNEEKQMWTVVRNGRLMGIE